MVAVNLDLVGGTPDEQARVRAALAREFATWEGRVNIRLERVDGRWRVRSAQAEPSATYGVPGTAVECQEDVLDALWTIEPGPEVLNDVPGTGRAEQYRRGVEMALAEGGKLYDCPVCGTSIATRHTPEGQEPSISCPEIHPEMKGHVLRW